MNIGEAAKTSGVSAKMIRYYESVGLIDPAARSDSGYRVYGEDDLHVLRFIKRARKMGFPMERIEVLLGLWRDDKRSSAEVKKLALRHVADLEMQIAEMQAVADTLRKLAATCHGDDRPHCPILDDLSEEHAAPARQHKRRR
ncbi:MAG: Cu(I)-responsive transcriptional regulator, partial [Parvibaculum sp.]